MRVSSEYINFKIQLAYFSLKSVMFILPVKNRYKMKYCSTFYIQASQYCTTIAHKVSFSLITQILNHLLHEASLQQLKMEALIPPPAAYEVGVYDKVFECTEHSADRNSSSAVSSVWPHTARWSTLLLQEFDWKVFNHYPPYCPDLAPRDVHLF